MQEVRCPQCHNVQCHLDYAMGTIGWMGSIVWKKEFRYEGLLAGYIKCRHCGDLVPILPPKGEVVGTY